MKMPLKRVHASEEGQSLGLILVVIVIGAVIAFAIAARTVQDIRRTGQERISDQAGTQVETFLDGITSTAIMSIYVNEDLSFTKNCTAMADGICTLDRAALDTLFGDIACDDAWVKLKKVSGIEATDLDQDDVLQIDLEGLSGPGTFQISWSGSKHLLIMIYARDPLTNEVYLWETGQLPPNPVAPVALTVEDIYDIPSEHWGLPAQQDTLININYPANPLFARVRPVGGAAVINATGVPDQQLAIKAACNLNGIYREFVRIVPAYTALPAAFDYVLYDRDSAINEF